MPKIVCYQCKHTWSFNPPLGRSDECPNCGSNAKVCLNCRFHDENAYRSCKEPQASWVKDKEQGNFCGYFEPSSAEGAGASQSDDLKKLENLFGGKTEEKAAPKGGIEDELKAFLDKRGRS